MFQNISEEIEENVTYNINDETKKDWKIIIKNMFKPQKLILYIIAFLASMVSIINGQVAFGIAIFAASCSSGAIALPVFVLTLVGTFIGFGKTETLIYLLDVFVFLGLMLTIKPHLQEDTRNEKKKLGMHLVSAVFLVQALKIFSASFTIGVVLETILQCIIIYIFYKVFVNSIPVIENFGKTKAFTAEEAIGASLLMSIAICSIGAIEVFGISIRNTLCLFLVLMLAWRNGALIGTTAGVTLGVILTMLGFGENTLIIVYALAGLIIGALNRIEKIGMALVIAIGFAVIFFVNNIPYINYIKEVLVAAVFLLIMPKNISIDIEDVIGKTKLLPVTKDNRLEENKDTIYKLNSMSDAINEIAKSYEEVAATVIEDDEELKEKNKKMFIDELKINLENISDNMLYEDIVESDDKIAGEIFETLINKEEIERDDLIQIFENHNSYIVGVEDKEIERQTEKQIYQMVRNINYTYQICKSNFIWKRKVCENNKIVSEQFNKVSEVINNIAKDIEKGKEEKKEIENKYKLNIGISRTTKNNNKVSGDSSTQLKLADEKYLLAISDGMGSGTKARKSSKKAITMLENLLSSGFKKEESIDLINSALRTNQDDDMYATLDISIIDLHSGNIEFVKSGACPTYIKTKDGIQILKENSIPAGLVNKMNLITYDRDLENGDIIVMCSDGIIDSGGRTDENWLKEMLEEIRNRQCTKNSRYNNSRSNRQGTWNCKR